MNSPIVSIGLPVYNGANFIQEAIASVLNQHYEDFELIIRDNASTDNTEAVCRELALRDRRIRYVRNETNIGAGPNFSAIVALAQGRYFKWLAHDDLIAPTFLTLCVEALEADPTAVLACPRVRFINAQGTPMEDYSGYFGTDHPDPVVRFGQTFHGYPCYDVFGVIRMKDLRRTNLMGNYMRGDGVLLAHLALLGRFAEVREYLFYLRRHERQSTYVFGYVDPEEGPDFEAYAQWFDPRNQKGLSRSFSRMLVNYIQMIRSAPLSGSQRRRCYQVVGRWFLASWRTIAGEWKRTLLDKCGMPYSQPRRRKRSRI